MRLLRSPYLSVWLAVAVSLGAFSVWLAYPADVVFVWMEEGGPVETLTEWIYMAAIIIILFFGASILERKKLVAILLVLAYMLARERDLNKAEIFPMSMLKIKFWLSGGVPVTDKLTAAVILLPAAWAGLYLLFTYWTPVVADIRKRLPYAISVLMVIVVTVVSKILDRSLNMLTEIFGWTFPDWLHALEISQEETLECLIPFLFIVALFQYRQYVLR